MCKCETVAGCWLFFSDRLTRLPSQANLLFLLCNSVTVSDNFQIVVLSCFSPNQLNNVNWPLSSGWRTHVPIQLALGCWWRRTRNPVKDDSVTLSFATEAGDNVFPTNYRDKDQSPNVIGHSRIPAHTSE